MTHAAIPSVQFDTDAAHADSRAVLHMFQVIAINLACFVVFTGVAILFGVSWWMSVLIGWIAGSVATLPVAALVILLWPVASAEAALPVERGAMIVADTQSHLDMWRRDVEDELDAAFLAAANAGHPAPGGWHADIERQADVFDQKAEGLAAIRRAA
ncbi:MAG: hypothetical protein ACOCYW_04940 [Roseicyclus sp.]